MDVLRVTDTQLNEGASPLESDFLSRYYSVWQRSRHLAEPLSEEDCCVQSMVDASPIKWHLAHTTWFFETFILAKWESGFAPFHPAFQHLFNSYYNGVGEPYPRSQRGLLTRPSFAEIEAYRTDVDRRMAGLLTAQSHAVRELVTLGLHHEQQHQELMLTDVKHLLSMNPLKPAYIDTPMTPAKIAAPLEWKCFDATLAEIGYAGDGFCFDNERPRHRQFIEPFSLASRLITNGEYLEFIDAGGYRDPIYWLASGWDWINRQSIHCPLYWFKSPESGGWMEFTLHGASSLDLHRPVTHISLFEADAFARWADARLPTEAEWEYAVSRMPDSFAAPGSLHPERCAEDQHQWFGACWQWTSSSYSAYPGYTPPAGVVGEYNGKFMIDQYVLRGSSCVTPPGHTRLTYRNFFPTSIRWQFTGIRLAK